MVKPPGLLVNGYAEITTCSFIRNPPTHLSTCLTERSETNGYSYLHCLQRLPCYSFKYTGYHWLDSNSYLSSAPPKYNFNPLTVCLFTSTFPKAECPASSYRSVEPPVFNCFRQWWLPFKALFYSILLYFIFPTGNSEQYPSQYISVMHFDLDQIFHFPLPLILDYYSTWNACSINDLDISKALNICILATAKPDQILYVEQYIATKTDSVRKRICIHIGHCHNLGRCRVTHLSRLAWWTCSLCHSPSCSDSAASLRGRGRYHTGVLLFYKAECSVRLKGGETIDDSV